LEDEGKLIRTFGGAVSCGMEHGEQERLNLMQSLAACVVSEIQEGDSVILNAGNTTLMIAWNLKQFKKLQVITNSLSIAKELGGYPGIQLILLGGEMTADAVFTHGGEAIRQLEKYKANKLILSASGVSCDRGITTRHMEAGELFRKMMERSGEVIVVADSTKINFDSFYYVSSLNAADKIVTNCCEENENELQRMERQGIQVIRC
jgi:DeoR/GlpR family transcriptional regulator of sugar metabolism